MYKYLFSLLAVFLLISCGDSEPSNARLQVSLVDAPASYDAVNIDVQEVNVRFSEAIESEDAEDNADSENGWQDISDFESGVVNILDLVNGAESILVDREIPSGKLGEVRLVLGTDNTLVMDGQTYDLTIPSGAESGLKIKLNADLLAGVTYKLVLDFDAAKSVTSTGSGKFNLNPVVHANMEAQTGAITGTILPADLSAVVYAIQGEDSVSTYPDENGEFLLRALDAGTYDVVAVPEELEAQTIEGVEVIVGQVANAGEFDFNQ